MYVTLFTVCFLLPVGRNKDEYATSEVLIANTVAIRPALQKRASKFELTSFSLHVSFVGEYDLSFVQSAHAVHCSKRCFSDSIKVQGQEEKLGGRESESPAKIAQNK